MTEPALPSYSSGTSTVPLLGDTIGANLDRTAARVGDHEALVECVAREMGRAGRIAWRGLGLRARVPCDDADKPYRWCVARPDVFSIRYTSDHRLITAFPATGRDTPADIDRRVNQRLAGMLVAHRPLALTYVWLGHAWVNASLLPRIVQLDDGLIAAVEGYTLGLERRRPRAASERARFPASSRPTPICR